MSLIHLVGRDLHALEGAAAKLAVALRVPPPVNVRSRYCEPAQRLVSGASDDLRWPATLAEHIRKTLVELQRTAALDRRPQVSYCFLPFLSRGIESLQSCHVQAPDIVAVVDSFGLLTLLKCPHYLIRPTCRRFRFPPENREEAIARDTFNPDETDLAYFNRRRAIHGLPPLTL